MKRIRPAPQGRAFRYQRRIAHIELVLAERGRTARRTLPAETRAAMARSSGEAAGSGGEESCGGQEEESGCEVDADSRFLTRALRGFGMTGF